MDGSGRMSLRNRQFLKPITPYTVVDTSVNDGDEMALEDGESETVQQEPARASTRKRWRPDRYGVAG